MLRKKYEKQYTQTGTNTECKHRRIKKNFPFGRKSTPFRFCKDCGKVITPHDIMKRKKLQNVRV